MPVNNLIQLRKGNSSTWSSQNPVLSSGEPGYDLTNNILKVGDGVTPWNNLSGISTNLDTSLAAGSGIIFSYADSTLTISTSGGGGGGGLNNVVEDITPQLGGNLDLNSYSINGTGNISISGNVIANTGSYNALTVNSISVSLSGHTHTASDITNFNEAVDDRVGSGLLVAGTGIGLNYNDTANTLTINVTNSPRLVTTVFNKTGSTIPKFRAVYINGGQGDQPTITLAANTGDATSAATYGVTSQAIDDMSTGEVVVFGAITGINTDQFNPSAPMGNVNGTILYLSASSGIITSTKPYAPNHIVTIGTIVRTHQNEGVVEVRIQNGFELEEIHDVSVTGVTNGQFLQYNSSNDLWIPSSSGNFTTLQLNGTTVSVSGHTHTSSDITNFNSSVSGLLPTIANSGDNRILTSTGSSVGINAEANLTFDGTNLNLNNQTASTIASFDSSKNLVSLSTTTYPSFTELSYVKGVTSSIQTQIDGKSSTSHSHGNITSAGAIGSTANLPLITTTSGVITTGSFGSTANTFCQGNDSRLSDSRAPTGSAGGDLTGTYPNPTLTTTGVTGGTYRSVTVDTKGRITAGTNPTTLAGYGITDVGNGTLTLSVSGTGLSGSASFTANQSGNATFTVTSNATNANTGSTIVARDASGNFSAGTITATLSGNASTATSATTATGLNASNYITRSGSSGNANTDFSNTPAGTVRHNGDDANLTNGPGNAWWFYDNYRHNNATNVWGTQIAWGWEDNANRLAQRNVTAGTWGAWVYYLNSGNYNSYAPSLTGGGASGTWSISITGTAAGETLGTVTGRGTTTNSIVQSNASVRAPIFYDSNDTNYYLDPNGTSVLNRVNPIGWDTSGRNYSREWIELPNFTGLLSGNNGAYFYPNNASYGAWRIAGTRNGWAGLEFDSTGAGQISLMMNSGHTGVHNNTYGWQWYWTGGAFYVSKGANGGGTIATVLDTSNYAANAPVSVRTFRAWGYYNGAAAVPIGALDGVNVSTMSRSANGTHIVTFAITLPNADYGAFISSGVGSSVITGRGTSSVSILTQTTAAVPTNTLLTVGIVDTI